MLLYPPALLRTTCWARFNTVLDGIGRCWMMLKDVEGCWMILDCV